MYNKRIYSLSQKKNSATGTQNQKQISIKNERRTDSKIQVREEKQCQEEKGKEQWNV